MEGAPWAVLQEEWELGWGGLSPPNALVLSCAVSSWTCSGWWSWCKPSCRPLAGAGVAGCGLAVDSIEGQVVFC